MMNNNFRKPLYTLLLAMPLLAAGCADNGPWPMPSGYTYEHDQYKAPPGPEPVFKKWQYEHGMTRGQPPSSMSTQMTDTTSTTTTAAATTDTMANLPTTTGGGWDRAAHELVSRLITDFGRPTEPVWLQSDGAATDQSLQFEKALLAALQQSEIHLATDPGAGPFVLKYSVGGGSDSAHALLTITMLSAGHKAASESGVYAVSDAPAADSMSGMPAPAAEAPTAPPDMSPMATTTTNSAATTTTSTSTSGTMPDAAAGQPVPLKPHYND